jgi:hypothetical protein
MSIAKSMSQPERDENTFAALKEMAGDIYLCSRNDNDEIIGIEYFSNFDVLTYQELAELEAMWRQKMSTCLKEKLASQWMIVQVFLFIALANYIAYLSGGIAGAIASVIGLIAIIAIIEDKRVMIATRNLKDAKRVHMKITKTLQGYENKSELILKQAA